MSCQRVRRYGADLNFADSEPDLVTRKLILSPVHEDEVAEESSPPATVRSR